MEQLKIGNGGWVCYVTADEERPAVYVRFDDVDGHLAIVDLFLGDERGLSAEVLRWLPIGRIEAWANAPDTATLVRRSFLFPGPDLRRAARHFGSSFGATSKGPVDHWVAQMLQAQIEGSGVPQAPMPKPPRRPPADEQVIDARIAVPAGPGDRGDDFYRHVAQTYSQVAQATARPAPIIAEASEVPVSTVHRWVKEARRRGFLSPGRTGKAG